VPISDQDHRCVAVTVAVSLGGLDQLLDLGVGQVFALAVGGVNAPALRNCTLFAGRRHHRQVRFCSHLQSLHGVT
jgi:hypothetical protein